MRKTVDSVIATTLPWRAYGKPDCADFAGGADVLLILREDQLPDKTSAAPTDQRCLQRRRRGTEALATRRTGEAGATTRKARPLSAAQVFRQASRKLAILWS